MKIMFYTISLIYFLFLITQPVSAVDYHLNKNVDQKFYSELALRWAPIHYQNVYEKGKHSFKGRSDHLTAIDFDGDWDTSNNWKNLDPLFGHQTSAHVYYSVVESVTHWYIVYGFFHPRDWTCVNLFKIDEHENDLEGILLIVSKSDTKKFGNLEAMVSVFHRDFYSYINPERNFKANQEDIDGLIHFEKYKNRLHPMTTQEAMGHGIKAYPYLKRKQKGIVYVPSLTESEVPKNHNYNKVKYKLVPIIGKNKLWDKRNDPLVFNDQGYFYDTHGYSNAHPPWNWDDHDDGLSKGLLAIDPIFLVNVYFNNLGKFSFVYLYNPFLKFFNHQ
jgi:hypothetical protein